MTSSARARITQVIAAHVAEWECAHVELAVYGTDSADVIAGNLATLCRDVLGAEPTRALFHASSNGCVTGLELADGRRVVVKAHPLDAGLERLTEIVRLQRFPAAAGLPATPVLVGPIPVARGFAIVELYVDAGAAGDAHDPLIRSALASGLHAIVEATHPLVPSSPLDEEGLPTALWRRPHNKLLDFEATRAGAEHIEALASAASEHFASVVDAGDLVIGHADWRAEHVRWDAQRIVAAYDWDSLSKKREPVLVGQSAHCFCADWTRNETIAPAPTLDEARAYVAAYERARRRPFDARERRSLAGSFAYWCAYAARCGHVARQDKRAVSGTFAHLVWTEGERLLAI